MREGSFDRLANSYQRSSITTEAEPYWPYPLPEAEMIARYGLRPLTPDERQLFPGLRLALQICKVQLTKPPAVLPLARAGWVVWMAETYPGHYLVRMPGGATLLAPHHKMSWTAVADDTPATTLAAAQAYERQRQWQAAVRSGLHQSLRL